MRIRPTGVELLEAARVVIKASIAPHVAEDRRDALRAVEQVMALAANRLANDVEASAADLAALEDARAAMRGKVLEALPQQCRYDARLVSKAISLAMLQLANAHIAERREYERLAALLSIPIEPHRSLRATRCTLPSLNEQLVQRIRAGEADAGTPTHAATLAFLEAITLEALSESNPTYQRRTSHSAPSSSRARPGTALQPVPVDAALVTINDVQALSVSETRPTRDAHETR